jgi:hypothetical protein
MSAPPLDAGAVQVSVIEPFPNVGIGVETLEGTVAGTIVFDVVVSLRPASVIATTLNV